MTRARRELVSIEATPYYHVISRCVRRAYLCGTDNFSGKNYEHRKAWVVERLRELDRVFTIDRENRVREQNPLIYGSRVNARMPTHAKETTIPATWISATCRPAGQ